MTRRSVALAVAGTATAMVAGADLFVLDHHLHGWPHGFGYWLEGSLSLPIWLAVGLVLVYRVPGNMLGPVALFYAVVDGIQLLSGAAGTDLAADHATTQTVNIFAGVSAAGQIAVVGTLLVFAQLMPTGKPTSPRWRWLLVVTVVGFGSLALAVTALDDGVQGLVPVARAPWGPLPHAVAVGAMALANLAAFTGIGGVVVGLWLRWRRGNGLERQQLKTVLFAAVVAASLVVVVQPITDRIGLDNHVVGSVMWTIIPTALPVATTIAILRYRLYDIDRIVSRTLSYAVVTALVLGTYVGAIAVANRVVGGSSSIGVAASTLAAAAAFQPLRRRVQRVVDRRFDRAAYDARRTADGFSGQLRNEVDVDTVQATLLGTVSRAVAPATASLWVPGR